MAVEAAAPRLDRSKRAVTLQRVDLGGRKPELGEHVADSLLVAAHDPSPAFGGLPLPDTLLLDCERRRFSLVWRLSQRIHRTILDFSEAWVGPPTPAMLRARAAGREYIRAAGLPEDA